MKNAPYLYNKEAFFMSKKKIYNKHLEKGSFYLHNDRNGGHPSLLYKKRDKKNMYFVVVFTTKPGKKRTKLRFSIEPKSVKVTYVHNLPVVSKRKDMGKKELTRMKLSKEDKPLIKSIEKKK